MLFHLYFKKHAITKDRKIRSWILITLYFMLKLIISQEKLSDSFSLISLLENTQLSWFHLKEMYSLIIKQKKTNHCYILYPICNVINISWIL